MVLEGGESSALTNLGYLASTNFVQTAFVNTSAGVMPLGGSRYSIWFAENSSKPTYESNGLIQNFTSYNVSYRQQGLTATVTCTSENTSPLNYTVAQSFPNGNSNLSIIMPTIVCNNAAPAPLAQLVVGTDFLLASSCSLANQTQYVRFPNLPSHCSDLLTRGFPSDIFARIWSVRNQSCGWYYLDRKHDLST